MIRTVFQQFGQKSVEFHLFDVLSFPHFIPCGVPHEQDFFDGIAEKGIVSFQKFPDMFVVFDQGHDVEGISLPIRFRDMGTEFIIELPDFLKDFRRGFIAVLTQRQPCVLQFGGESGVQTQVAAEFAQKFRDGSVFTFLYCLIETFCEIFELFPAHFTVVSEKMIDGYMEDLCDDGEHFDVGVRSAVLPAADGLKGHAELCGKLVLGHIGGTAETAEIISNVQFHDGFLSL